MALYGIISLWASLRICFCGSASSWTDYIHSNLGTLPNNRDALSGPCLCLDKLVMDHCLLRLSPAYGLPGSDIHPLGTPLLGWGLPRPGSFCLITLLSWSCSQPHLCQPAVVDWSRHFDFFLWFSTILIRVIHKAIHSPQITDSCSLTIDRYKYMQIVPEVISYHYLLKKTHFLFYFILFCLISIGNSSRKEMCLASYETENNF